MSTVALQTRVDSLYRALPNAKAECDATTALDEADEGILELEDALPASNDAVVALQDLTASANTSLAAYLRGRCVVSGLLKNYLYKTIRTLFYSFEVESRHGIITMEKHLGLLGLHHRRI